MEQALDGVRVLDLTTGAAGGLCTMHLADFGADVIRVEPEGEACPPLSARLASRNRNKRSILLSPGNEAMGEVLLRLAGTCDVLVEDLAPGELSRLGLGWDAIHKAHPRLILASVSGHGRTGPLRDVPAHPLTSAARSGLLDRTGPSGSGPMKPGVELGSSWTGVSLLSGITMALLHQLETGEGCRLEVSALDSLFYLLELFVIEYSSRGSITPKNGNQDTEVAPLGTFRARDGHIALAVSTEGQWAKLCTLLDLEGLRSDPRFADNAARVAHLSELIPALEGVTQGWEKLPLERLLGENKLAAGAVRTVAELLDDPQVRGAEMIVDTVHSVLGPLHLIGSPMKMSATPAQVTRSPAPRPGEHTAQVLAEREPV